MEPLTRRNMVMRIRVNIIGIVIPIVVCILGVLANFNIMPTSLGWLVTPLQDFLNSGGFSFCAGLAIGAVGFLLYNIWKLRTIKS